MCVDEQLFSFKSKCPFHGKQPDRFEIKYWIAADVKNKYLFNGFSHQGKGP